MKFFARLFYTDAPPLKLKTKNLKYFIEVLKQMHKFKKILDRKTKRQIFEGFLEIDFKDSLEMDIENSKQNEL